MPWMRCHAACRRRSRRSWWATIRVLIITTIPEVLDDAGYQSAMSGKWYVGHSQVPAPGFEFWFAHRYGGGPYYGAPTWRDGEPAEQSGYFTDALTENALDFVASELGRARMITDKRHKLVERFDDPSKRGRVRPGGSVRLPGSGRFTPPREGSQR